MTLRGKNQSQSASDLLVRCLEAEGVRYVFGVPGEENEDLMFSLAASRKVEFVPTRHEQGGAFMADVWGRLTGEAGVCLATLGPGATNLITGLGDAQLDKSPVVALTGQGGLGRMHKESHQMIDVVDMFGPVVKWNTSITAPAVVPETVRKAFKLATLEKPGVTHLELPEDVARLPAKGKPIAPRRIRRPAPDFKAVAEAYALLKKAKRPVILAGNGAIRKLASRHLHDFVSRANIPVVSTFMGKGAIPDDDPHSLMTIGLKGRDFQHCALEASDLVVAVGYDIAEYAPEAWNRNHRPIIHVDFEPAEVYEHYQPAVELVCDISAVLWEFNQRLEAEHLAFSDWYAPVRKEVLRDHGTYKPRPGKKLTVPGVLHILREATPRDAVVISDVGAHKVWVGRNFPVYEPGTCLISNNFASMGIAVPGAVGAKLALPEREVVAVTGDGGFLMNSQELETAKRLGLSFTVVIVNDNNYGLISWKQHANRGRVAGTALGNPDFVRYAESFGAAASRPRTAAALGKELLAARKRKGVSVITVDIDSGENLRLSKKLDSNLCRNFALDT